MFNRKNFIVFLFSLLLFSYSYAQSYQEDIPVEDVVEVIEDENKNQKSTEELLKNPKNLQTNDKFSSYHFDTNLNEKYSSSEFDYTQTSLKESIFERLKRRLWEKIMNMFNIAPENTYYWYRVVLWGLRILGIGIVLYLVYIIVKYLVKKDGNLFLSKKNKNIKVEDTDIIEDINEIDFPSIISQYELEQNYNAAFRYQFLSVLKNLTDVGKIKWTQDKTNIDYLIELKEPEIKKKFKRAVYIFNHVWYGEFKIDHAAYKRYVEEIEPLKNNTYE